MTICATNDAECGPRIRTTERDRIGDQWDAPKAANRLTVVGKFNDWCLLMRGNGWAEDSKPGVYPLWWLAENGWRLVSDPSAPPRESCSIDQL